MNEIWENKYGHKRLIETLKFLEIDTPYAKEVIKSYKETSTPPLIS